MLRLPLLGACAIGMIAASSASATEAFIGRWAAKPEVCSARGGDNAANSALVATDTSLWWFDGYCRIDFRLAADGTPYFIEANPNPEIAPGEEFAQAALHAGTSYQDLLNKILLLGLQRAGVDA